jgi:hypothetical protein
MTNVSPREDFDSANPHKVKSVHTWMALQIPAWDANIADWPKGRTKQLLVTEYPDTGQRGIGRITQKEGDAGEDNLGYRWELNQSLDGFEEKFRDGGTGNLSKHPTDVEASTQAFWVLNTDEKPVNTGWALRPMTKQ